MDKRGPHPQFTPIPIQIPIPIPIPDPETETDWDSDGDETSVGPCDKLSNIRNLRKRRTTVAIH